MALHGASVDVRADPSSMVTPLTCAFVPHRSAEVRPFNFSFPSCFGHPIEQLEFAKDQVRWSFWYRRVSISDP